MHLLFVHICATSGVYITYYFNNLINIYAYFISTCFADIYVEEDEDRESKARKDAEAGQGRAYLSHLIVWQVYQNSSSS